MHQKYTTPKRQDPVPGGIGVASYGAPRHVPLDFQQFDFSVNFRAAQSLTATLCGCFSKHAATAAAMDQS